MIVENSVIFIPCFFLMTLALLLLMQSMKAVRGFYRVLESVSAFNFFYLLL
ncbi:unnamed protein product [Moneuplotes crassus]|uniref:Uncharacterized protein n=1 Tax=Euplotes crassus TaxID=5936 RepID=A0AAD1XLL1_EUPCR|nr:unnamed protein product [Moneuplotes crassus]